MITLLKNAMLFDESGRREKDILVAGNTIYKITNPGEIREYSLIKQIIPCGGLMAFPGLIDQHAHIIGAGGETGFESRIPELNGQDILNAGVTTLVGLLGADGCARSLKSLHAKAKSLEAQGITTFLYSGCYRVPPITFTGDLIGDLVLIDKVIGVKAAISDHRSSQPDFKDLRRLSSDAHMGGLLGEKAGIVHLHVGDGKGGLNLLLRLLEQSDLPKEQFVPTHVNRGEKLFCQAMDYCRSGGNIDLTSGEKDGVPVPRAIEMLVGEGLDLSRVTVSSDANGSIPGGGVSGIKTLYWDIISCITRGVLKPEDAFRLATENVAKILKLYPRKGKLREGSDADILLVDKSFEIKLLLGRGIPLLNHMGRISFLKTEESKWTPGEP